MSVRRLLSNISSDRLQESRDFYADLLGMEVHDEHDEGCCCRVLWDTVRERYELDARALPDEMRPMRRQWTHGQVGTWLWWD